MKVAQKHAAANTPSMRKTDSKKRAGARVFIAALVTGKH
jgi:hypothetical protein